MSRASSEVVDVSAGDRTKWVAVGWDPSVTVAVLVAGFLPKHDGGHVGIKTR